MHQVESKLAVVKRDSHALKALVNMKKHLKAQENVISLLSIIDGNKPTSSGSGMARFLENEPAKTIPQVERIVMLEIVLRIFLSAII